MPGHRPTDLVGPRATRRALLACPIVALTSVAMASARQTPATSRWTTSTPLPVPRSEFAATVAAGMIYVAGGFGAERAFTRFDPTTADWAELAPLPAPRHHLGLAALDDGIYVIGGHDEHNSATDTAWCYDIANDAWTDLPVMPQGPRGALGCAALQGRIIAVGGSSGDLSGPATSDVAAFDPATESWALLPPMPTAREHLAVASVGDVLLAVGGRDGGQFSETMDTAVERFDATTERWATGAPLPNGRSGMGVASDTSSVLVLGGEGRNGIYDQVQRYDVVNDTWSDLPNLPVARHGIAAAVVNETLYAIGGNTSAFTVENSAIVEALALP